MESGGVQSGSGPAPSSEGPKRAGVVLATLILVAGVANLNLSVANVALPDIGKAFDAGQTELNLIAVGYSLGLAASVLYLGAVGDRYGRKSLLLGHTLKNIVGMDPAESDRLLDRLFALADEPRYIYSHDWRVGDILIWDNTGTMHRVVPFDLDCGRELERVKLAGEEPIKGTSRLLEVATH